MSDVEIHKPAPKNNGTGRITVAVSVQPKKSGRGRYPRINDDLWSRMLEAYREKATIAHVMRKADVGEKRAKRAIFKGWPDLKLPPFKEIGRDRALIYEHMASHQTRLELSAEAQSEGAKQAAEEALACREVLRNSVRGGAIISKLLEQVERGIATGRIMLEGLNKNDKGELTGVLSSKSLTALTRSVASLASAVEKAMTAERMRTGKPEDAAGVQIGMLIDGLSPQELAGVADSGALPDRIVRLGAKPPDDIAFDEDMRPEGFEEDMSEKEDPAGRHR